MLKWLWLSSLVLVLDQSSKWAMTSWLSLYDIVKVVPFFNLIMAYNSGAAFGFLLQAGGWKLWFFTIISVIVSTILLIWLKRLRFSDKLESISISLILGGTVGNLVDRIILGYVIDFLDLYNYFGSYHFPAFNIADSSICFGVTILLIDNFKCNRR
ncbi:MAG: lipoprotein signal peptidase [Piscirickettsiaceae bacterium]|nr:lipoprotein signal peptidase [Piscirickettsiaceae bacterium]